jgi:hypothetical protein
MLLHGPRRRATSLRPVPLWCAGLVLSVAPVGAQTVAPAAPTARWYKGQTHCHTLNSDGDSTADDVIKWYRQQRYHFLVLSDHDVLTPVGALNEIYGAASKVSSDPRVTSNPFLLIPGEEVTDKFLPAPGNGAQKEIHLTAINVRRAVVPQGGTSVADTLQRDVEAIRAASGFAIVNHPLLHWSMTADDLGGLRGVKAFEVWNGGTHTNNLGGAGSPGTEELWDQVLSRGLLLYGVGADDAHEFKDPSFPMALTIPGRAWIMVRASELTAEAIVAAMERGDFYATTGLELSDYEVTPKAISITIRVKTRFKYDVAFIGRDGRVLKKVPVPNDAPAAGAPGGQPRTPPPVVYDIRGDEGYVRAKITDSNGYVAWTQPVLVPAR